MTRGKGLKIPAPCRVFGPKYLGARRDTAEEFVRNFARHIAPPRREDDRDECWTRAIRGRLREMCPDNCYALPDSPYTCKSDYVADFIWTESEGGNRLVLACECEWGTGWFGKVHWGRVESKLEKLLAVKAPFKVLIFSSVDKSNSTELNVDFTFAFAKQRLETSLNDYLHHIPGETYVFVDFPQTRSRNVLGKFRSLIWTSAALGKQSVSLQAGPDGSLPRTRTSSFLRS
jgi:hypothetical protein